MPEFDRRYLLKTAAAAAMAPALPRALLEGPNPDRYENLARRLIDMPRDRLFETIEPLMRDGLAWRDLLAAVFHAGVLEVQPRPVGFSLHCVMVVESMFQTAEAGSEAHAWRAALWNLRDFKASQARDARRGDWQLASPPAIDRTAASADAIASELRAALRGDDAERARCA